MILQQANIHRHGSGMSQWVTEGTKYDMGQVPAGHLLRKLAEAVPFQTAREGLPQLQKVLCAQKTSVTKMMTKQKPFHLISFCTEEICGIQERLAV